MLGALACGRTRGRDSQGSPGVGVDRTSAPSCAKRAGGGPRWLFGRLGHVLGLSWRPRRLDLAGAGCKVGRRLRRVNRVVPAPANAHPPWRAGWPGQSCPAPMVPADAVAGLDSRIDLSRARLPTTSRLSARETSGSASDMIPEK